MEKEDVKKMRPEHGFYQVTVVVEVEDQDSGKVKKQKEIRLVDGVSPSDIEQKVAKEMEGTMWDWEIVAMTRSKIQVVY